jgi:hypothetical protein
VGTGSGRTRAAFRSCTAQLLVVAALPSGPAPYVPHEQLLDPEQLRAGQLEAFHFKACLSLPADLSPPPAGVGASSRRGSFRAERSATSAHCWKDSAARMEL